MLTKKYVAFFVVFIDLFTCMSTCVYSYIYFLCIYIVVYVYIYIDLYNLLHIYILTIWLSEAGLSSNHSTTCMVPKTFRRSHTTLKPEWNYQNIMGNFGISPHFPVSVPNPETKKKHTHTHNTFATRPKCRQTNKCFFFWDHIYSVEMTFSPPTNFCSFTRKKTCEKKISSKVRLLLEAHLWTIFWLGMEVGGMTFDSSIKGRKKQQKIGGFKLT